MIWKLVQKSSSKDVNIITSKWVFKAKYTLSSLIDCYKARLVARCFTQIHNIDYKETFFPILQLELLSMLMVFAAYFGLEVEQIDIPDAYLKGNLNETIYMEIPQSHYFLQNHQQRNCVLHLFQLLYGLKQSGREQNKKTKKHLKSIKFVPITVDNCVFFNKSTHIIIALYMDDLLIFAKSMISINVVKSQLVNEYKMKVIEKTSFILGIRIRSEVKQKQLAIDQST